MTMQDTINIAIFLVVILIALVNWLYQRRQAAALQEVNDAAQRWLEFQVKDRRAQHAADVRVLDPLDWLNTQVGAALPGVTLTEMTRVIAPARTAEFVVSGGRKLLVSTLKPGVLKAQDRSLRASGGDRLADFAARPMFSSRRVQETVLSLADNEWLDLEAGIAGEQFGVDWGQPDRLYLYLVG